MQPRRNLRGRNFQQNNPLCGSFHMYIFVGDIYVNAGADGLDSNGDIVIFWGNIEILTFTVYDCYYLINLNFHYH